jgi:hypothetical protein
MPRESIPLVRLGGFADAEKFYVLSYEGTKSEKKYFEDLRQSTYFNDSGQIETIPLKRPKNAGSNPISVRKLLSQAKNDYNFKSTDEFWLIIDRDDWEKIHKLDISALVEGCKKEKNFFIAMSNPCFEIWLILHLTPLSTFSEDEQRAIFENEKISAKKNHIDKVLATCINNGRGYNKTPDPEFFLPKVYDAIINARSIANAEEDYPSKIGTDVYKLVEKLIK